MSSWYTSFLRVIICSLLSWHILSFLFITKIIIYSWIEYSWINNCPNNFKPLFYHRYMDHIFILFRDKLHIPLFLNYLNRQHSSINFTMETEENLSLSFLDVDIKRNKNKFSTSVFRKPTFSGLGISYFSFCSYRFKITSTYNHFITQSLQYLL